MGGCLVVAQSLANTCTCCAAPVPTSEWDAGNPCTRINGERKPRPACAERARAALQARDELFFENYEMQIKFEAPAPEPGAPRGRPPPDGGGGMPPMGPMGPMGPGGMPMVPPMMMNPMMMQMMATQMNMMMGGGPGMMMGGPGRGMGGPGMPPMMGGGRGGGGRGMGPGPPGRRGGRGREYFDFDAPANQREQLNYGDI